MNKLFKCLVYDKQVSLSVLDTTELVDKAIKIHSLKGNAAVTLGNLLTCCAYMSGCLKSERGAVSLTVKAADGDGCVSVSGDVNGHIRGYVDGSCNHTLKGGSLTVIKDDGFFRPFTGACEIYSDDVSAILTEYFHVSEQIPTAVSVGVKLNPDGTCAAAGGVIMQLLPGTSDANADSAEERMQAFLNPAEAIESYGADGIVKNFFAGDYDEKGLYLTHPDYVCNCSRKKIEGVLLPLGKDELLNIIKEQGNVSVHCHYCNTDYEFGKEDVEKLFDK
ncbi:MAG: Hsp33 family molecular chaperone HslO [Candidatus Coproplasma sp.]